MAFGPFDVMRSDTDNLSVIYPVRYILLHRHDTEIESLHDLKRLNKSVGITQSAVTIKNILIKNKIGFYEINNYEQGIKMLAAGRLDAVLSSDIFAYSFLQSNNLAKVIAFPGYVYQKTNIWIVVSKKSPVNTELLRNDIKLGVEKLRKKGVIETILAKHSGKDWDK
jgi:ABC-type amino acid transport substrate-binding protein